MAQQATEGQDLQPTVGLTYTYEHKTKIIQAENYTANPERTITVRIWNTCGSIIEIYTDVITGKLIIKGNNPYTMIYWQDITRDKNYRQLQVLMYIVKWTYNGVLWTVLGRPQ